MRMRRVIEAKDSAKRVGAFNNHQNQNQPRRDLVESRESVRGVTQWSHSLKREPATT